MALAVVQVLEPKIPALDIHPQPPALDSAEAGAGVHADRIYGRHQQPLLAGTAVAGGFGGHHARRDWHAAVRRCGRPAPICLLLSFWIGAMEITVGSGSAPGLSGHGRQPGQHGGRGPAEPDPQVPRRTPSSSPPPIYSSSRPKRSAPLRPPGRAGPTLRRPGARAAQSARHHPRFCGNADPQRERGKRSGARNGGLHRLAKWTAPTR